MNRDALSILIYDETKSCASFRLETQWSEDFAVFCKNHVSQIGFEWKENLNLSTLSAAEY